MTQKGRLVKNTNQKGFSILEVLIILVVVVLLGAAGWYVYHKSHNPTTEASKASQPTTKPASYFTLAQWGVRAPYSGNLSLTVQYIDSQHAVLSSKQLLSNPDKTGCVSPDSVNFVVQRYGSDEYTTDDRMNDTGSALTSAQAYAQSKLNLTKVGDHYYLYQTIKAPCAAAVYDAIPQFSQTDSALKSITARLGEVPISASSAASQYKGWKVSTLKYEKIAYMYPDNWTVVDRSAAYGCVKPGADHVILTSPSKEQVELRTGQDCLGDAGVATFATVPINSLGQSLYLAFEDSSGDGASSPTHPEFACLSQTNNSKSIFVSTSKNIILAGGGTSSPPQNFFCYYPYDNSNVNQLPMESVDSIKNSSDFNTAKLIFESMKYLGS